MKVEKILYQYASPCGRLILASVNDSLCSCKWADVDMEDGIYGSSEVIEAAVCQLNEYFKGMRSNFNLKLSFNGTTFQKRVWMQLNSIPYGSTVTYKDFAVMIGNPLAVRAVANAVGANPLSIILPCHRVIGSNGRLVGYHGGLRVKRYLLDLENIEYER